MTAERRRVDLRLGDFACSIDGFGDPAAVLTRLLEVLAEAPEGARGGIALDDSMLETLRAEAAAAAGLAPEAVDAVPGLVVVTPPRAVADADAVEEAASPAPVSDIREALAAASSLAVDADEAAAEDDGPRRGWPSTWLDETEETEADAPFPEDAAEMAEDAPLEPEILPTEGDVAIPLRLDGDAPSEDQGAEAVTIDMAPAAAREDGDFSAADALADAGVLGQGDAAERDEPVEDDLDEDEDIAPAAAAAEDPIIARLRRVAAERRGEDLDADDEDEAAEEPIALRLVRDTPAAPRKESPLQRRGRRPRNIFGTNGAAAEAEAVEPMALDAGMMVGEGEAAAEEPLTLGAEAQLADVETEGADPVLAPRGNGPFRPLFKRRGNGAAREDAGAEEPEDEAAEEPRRRSLFDVSDNAPRRRPRPPMTAQALAWKMEAHKPDDQLIAAGAFLTFVEKKPRFARKEIFEVLDSIPGEIVRNLEVRIKNFGRLTRDGVFVQLETDSFTLSDEQLDRVSEYFDD